MNVGSHGSRSSNISHGAGKRGVGIDSPLRRYEVDRGDSDEDHLDDLKLDATTTTATESPLPGEHEQRLRAAIHAAVNDICKAEEPSMDVTTSKLFVAALSDLVYKQAEMLGSDMEKFARHCSRKMVSVDDVKLCARRNETLLAALTQYSLEQSRAKDVKKKGRPVKRKADTDDQP